MLKCNAALIFQAPPPTPPAHYIAHPETSPKTADPLPQIPAAEKSQGTRERPQDALGGTPRESCGESTGPAQNPRGTRGTPRLTRALLGTSAENPRKICGCVFIDLPGKVMHLHPRKIRGAPQGTRGKSAENPRRIRGKSAENPRDPRRTRERPRGAPTNAPAGHPQGTGRAPTGNRCA
jgi:hypothetical protein